MALKPNNNISVPEIDMGPFQTAVNEAATRVRGLWLGYIALLAYLFISVAAVTHRDLLLGNPVNLPVLQVKLPLIGFFAVAPMFFLINHFFLLLQLFGLGQRLREFNDEIAKTDLDESARRQVRRKLDTFTIVQMLAGPKKDREQVTGMFQRAIAIITLVIAPIMLLLIIQLQFLPYQDQLITWMHRGILAVDLCLLWMFWPSIKLGDWAPWRGERLPKWLGRVHWRDYIVSWRRYCVSWWLTLAMTIVMFFASLVATFPGEIADVGIKTQERSFLDDFDPSTDCNPVDDSSLSWLKPMQALLYRICKTEIIPQHWSKPADSYFSWLKGPLFGELKHSKIRERLIPFSRAIDLADDKTLIDLDKFDKINERGNKDNLEPWQAGRTLSLRNRNLRGAMFDRDDLRNVDLFQASLQGASLNGASLQGASLNGASLQGASLDDASLQGASLDEASLQGVSLIRANLQGASLYDANLQGASLFRANLQGASLFRANLQGASLQGALLRGASLNLARLQGASLNGAPLQGASLVQASLQGASLNGASLQGASLDGASLQGASLIGANLQGASLDGASLQGASLNGASLQGASLFRANLQGVSLEGARLQGASLRETSLWRVYGEPDRYYLEPIRVDAPQFTPLLQEEMTALKEGSLEGVTSEEVKERIKERLERLSKENDQENLPESFWTDLHGKMSEGEYQKNLAKRLEKQICNDEGSTIYVAQGLIKYRLESIWPDSRRLLAGRLLDDAEGRTKVCPGLKELDAESISKLRKWDNE